MSFSSLLSLIPLLAAVAAAPVRESIVKRDGGLVNMGYFVNWEPSFTPDNIDTSSLTHIIYAFADCDNTTGHISLSNVGPDTTQLFGDDSSSAPGNNLYGMLGEIYKLKLKQQNLKTILSIGGYTYSIDGHFAFVTDAGMRATFVSDAVTMLENFGLDGIDIDYEALTADQGPGFMSLFTELRTALDAHQQSKGDATPYLLTAATAFSPNTAYDVPTMTTALSYVNIMDYDFAGSWSTTTAFQSNLYDGAINIDAGVQQWITAGAPAAKLNMGIPLYGRSFEQTTGLNATFNGVGAGIIPYASLPEAGATETEDTSAVAASSYDPTKQELVVYDNQASVTTKAQYATTKGMGGLFYWDLSTDKTGTAALVNTGGAALSTLDSTPNHTNYPGSTYDNIKNNMGQGSSAPPSSGTGGGGGESASSTPTPPPTSTPTSAPISTPTPTPTSSASSAPPTGTCSAQKKRA